MTLEVHQFAPALGLPNASPFCMKLETYLRMAGLPYRLVNSGDVLGAPKREACSSHRRRRHARRGHDFIIDYLKGRYGDPLDAHLSPFERAQATAFQRLFEENLYWVLIHMRWAEAAGWARTRTAFFGIAARPLRWCARPCAAWRSSPSCAATVLGRHGAAEIQAIGCRDVTAVADFLADKPFMLGDRPTSLDATAHAFLANLLGRWSNRRSGADAQARPTLEAYCQRMKARYFE